MADIVVCDSAVATTFRVADGFVLVHRVRVAGDNVPGVDEAREVAKAAERDVDEGVGGAEACFDPYCDGWEEDGDKGKEDVRARHGDGGRPEYME